MLTKLRDRIRFARAAFSVAFEWALESFNIAVDPTAHRSEGGTLRDVERDARQWDLVERRRAQDRLRIDGVDRPDTTETKQ